MLTQLSNVKRKQKNKQAIKHRHVPRITIQCFIIDAAFQLPKCQRGLPPKMAAGIDLDKQGPLQIHRKSAWDSCWTPRTMESVVDYVVANHKYLGAGIARRPTRGTLHGLRRKVFGLELRTCRLDVRIKLLQ